MKYSGEISPLKTDLSIINKLGLEQQPIGMKFLFNQPEGVPKLKGGVPMCLMPEETRKNGPFYADKDNFVCAEPLFLGLANDDPFSNVGLIGTKCGLDIFEET